MPRFAERGSPLRLNLMLLMGLLAIGTAAGADDSSIDIVVPELSAAGLAGEAAFGEHCAACHGTTAGGSGKGPPLVHPIYVSSHHGDMAFVLAARQGARAHHWNFGDMPPVPDVTDQELADLIVYVRELQHANGLP
jgi:mono/diheme cytochrome c family protein